MRANSVDTVCIHVTNMAAIAALIDIYKINDMQYRNLNFSLYKWNLVYQLLLYLQWSEFDIPEHERPFPVYPSLHVQL